MNKFVVKLKFDYEFLYYGFGGWKWKGYIFYGYEIWSGHKATRMVAFTDMTFMTNEGRRFVCICNEISIRFRFKAHSQCHLQDVTEWDHLGVMCPAVCPRSLTCHVEPQKATGWAFAYASKFSLRPEFILKTEVSHRLCPNQRASPYILTRTVWPCGKFKVRTSTCIHLNCLMLQTLMTLKERDILIKL